MNIKAKNIVLVGRCFDILHYGHIEFLKKAKSYGANLTILLESDKRIKTLKGYSRPFHTQEQRKQMLEALSSVDTVITLPDIMTDEAYKDITIKLHPTVIVTTEGDTMLERKRDLATLIHASFIIVPLISSESTSSIAKKLNLE